MARPKRGGGRTTPKGSSSTGDGRRRAEPTPTPTDVAAQVVDLGEAVVAEGIGVDEADYWASLTQQYLRPSPHAPASATAAKVLNVAAKRRSAGAAAVARALEVYGPATTRERAARIATELTDLDGLPPWFDELGRVDPVEALRLGDVFDDAFSVHVDFERHGARLGLAVRVDPISGWAQQFLFGGTIAEVREMAAEDPHAVMTDLDLADARALLDDAMARRDRDWTDDDDPTADNDETLLALVEQRIGLLPTGGTTPTLVHELGPAEEVALIDEFVRAHGDGREAAGPIGELIVTFARDLADGRPLTWSPGRVRMFIGPFAMVVPRTQPGAEAMLAELPDLFADWLRFSAARTGLPDDALQLNLDTIDQTRQLLDQFGPGPDGLGFDTTPAEDELLLPDPGGPQRRAEFGPAEEWPL